MALSSVTAGSQAAAADLNQYKDHLEGASGATLAWFLRAASSQNVVIRLSDASGVQKLSIQDSAGSEVAAIDSNGGLTVAGSFTPGTLTLPTGSAPTPTTEGEVWWDSDDDQFVVGDGTGQVAIGAGTTDHGTLFGLADDDHTQYLKDKAAGGTAAEVPTHDHSVAAQAGTIAHSVTTGKTENDHHNRSHAMTSTSDHTATAHRMFVSDASGNVDEIALGANTTFLESNGTTAVPAFRTIVHGDLGSVGANDHHNEAHTVASHSDTSATGSELNTLTDGSRTTLHTHAGLQLVHSDNTGGNTTSTTEVDIVDITGLSIPANHGIRLEFNTRLDNDDAAGRNTSIGFHINGSEVRSAIANIGGSVSATTDASGFIIVEIPPRATNYDRGGFVRHSYWTGSTMVEGVNELSSSALPTATVTSITIRGFVSGTNATAYANYIRVWEMAD